MDKISIKPDSDPIVHGLQYTGYASIIDSLISFQSFLDFLHAGGSPHEITALAVDITAKFTNRIS